MFIECPRCGSTHSRLSRSFGLFDALMKSWSRLPYRCRVCRKRFYRLDMGVAEQREQELEALAAPEVIPETVPAPVSARSKRYRIVIRIRLPRLLRPREV